MTDAPYADSHAGKLGDTTDELGRAIALLTQHGRQKRQMLHGGW